MMENVVLGLSLLIGLGAAAWCVLAAHNLQRTYGTGSLSTLLYYQIFIAVFGLYGIAGQGIVRRILVSRGAQFATVETVWHLFSFLGAPFLILAWSMLLRFCREITGSGLRRGFSGAFFIAAFSLYLGYGTGIVLLNTTGAGEAVFEAFSLSAKAVFAALDAGSTILAVIWLRSGSARETSDRKRAAERATGSWLLGAWAVRLVLLIASGFGGVFFSLFVLFFFGGNIPALYAWRAFLLENVPPPLARIIETGWDPESFAAEFRISKREEDVIREVLKGKTNREIGETLFISLQTVKDHLYRIFQKTGVRNRVQLINLVKSRPGRGSRDSTRNTSS
jgi:DNA-binding CsgD family transcriptional regulator